MNIKEMIEARKQAELAVMAALNEFQRATGMAVHGVTVGEPFRNPNDISQPLQTGFVHIDARLPPWEV